MTNNVQVKITADVADLKVQMAAAEAVMKQTAKAANDAAKAIAMGDSSDAGRAKLLATTQAAVDTKAAFKSLTYEYKSLTEEERRSTNAGAAFLAQLREQAATAGMSQKQLLAYRAEQLGVAKDAKPLIASLADTSHGSAGVTRELLVMGRELSRGNFNRMAGSATILAGRLGILTPSVVGTAAAIASIVAPIGLATVAAYQFYEAQNDLLVSTVGLGAASLLTASQLSMAAASAAQYSGMSIRASTEAAAAFAGAGARSQEVVSSLAGSMKGYATLTGQDAADAQKKLAEAMHDPVRGAEELNAELGLLDATQLRQIRTMTEHGDRAGAVAVIAKALRERVDQAKAAGVEFNTVFSRSAAVLADDWEWLGRVTAAYVGLTEKVNLYVLATGGQAKQAQAQAAAARSLQDQAQLKEASGKGAAIVGTTPEARDAEQREKLAGSMKILQDALRADTRLHGANSDAVRADQAAIADYKRAIDTFLPSAEKAHRLAELDAQLANARKARDSGRVADLTRQKSTLETAGEVMNPGDVAQRANDAAAVASEKTPAPKKGKDERVAQWTEELREKLIASNDFYGDQTAAELKFWESKVSAAKGSATAQREVEGKIYEARRTLARQSYQDEIAAYNEKIAADRNNWTKEKSDIEAKMAFIKSKPGEESVAYRDAAKELERAQQDHDAKVLAEAQRAAKEETEELKHSLDAQQRAREANAKSSEVRIRSNAGATPFGDIKADQQIAAQQQQLIRQKLADNDTFHAREAERLAKNVEDAATQYSGDVESYAAAIAAKKAEDQRYADEKQSLDAQLRLEQEQSIAQLKAKYESYISGTVATSVSGISKMMAGQMTLKNFGISVYQSIAREAEQQVAKLATEWIAKHLLMAVASKLFGESQADAAPAAAASTIAASKAQVAALAGVAGAGGVASMAAAPWPLDMDAPAFGAEMATVALSMGGFAKGMNVVPNDMVALIHSGERIIPKADNAALLEMTARGAGGGGGSGTNHYHTHYSPTVNGQMPFADQLAQHEDNVITMLQRAARRALQLREQEMSEQPELQSKVMGNIMYTMALAQNLFLALAYEGLVPARTLAARLDNIALAMDQAAADPQQQFPDAVREARQRLDDFVDLFDRTVEQLDKEPPLAHDARVVDVMRRAVRSGAVR